MVPTNEFLTLVTLIINNNLTNNLENYEPAFVKSSRYYYKINATSALHPVEFDPIFSNKTLFPKCCPPDFSYDLGKKVCVESQMVSSIFQDLKVKVNLVKSGLSECQVVVDRFVKGQDIVRAPAKNLKVGLKVSKDRIPNGKYCLDKIAQKNAYVIKICDERKYCINNTKSKDWCVNKCCWEGYSYTGRKCKYAENYALQDDKYRKYYENEGSYGFMYGITECKKQHVHLLDRLSFSINSKGDLILKRPNQQIYTIGDYCLDSAAFTDSEDRNDIVILCDHEKRINIRLVVTLFVVIIVFACFVTAFLKSFLIYELQGLTIKLAACYTLVESIFWILIAMKMLPAKFGQFCNVFGYVHTLMSISRLSWLNVLEYEIWRTIGNPKSGTYRSKNLMWLRLIRYSLYAVTIPAVTMVIFILSHQRIYLLPLVITPQLNIFTCTVQLDTYGALHVLIPAIILIFVNLLLFGKILCCCPPTGNNDVYFISYTNTSADQDTFVVNNKELFIVVKLAIINIITWIYYMGAYSRIFNSEYSLENVGGKQPPDYSYM